MKCYVCEDKIEEKFSHFYTCANGLSKPEHLINLICYNSNTSKSDFKNDLINMYVVQDFSIKDLLDHFNIQRLSSSTLYKIIYYLGIPKKTTTRSKRTQEKYKKTCLEKYGTINALSKDTIAYHKRNDTVKRKYEVDNVRSAQEIKDKINITMLAKYGTLRRTNIEKQKETKANWSNEYRAALGDKISAGRKKWWANLTDSEKYNACKRSGLNQYSGKMNSIESVIAEALASLGISYIFSYFIGNRQFDFKIGTILIECQGDFWHANPIFYNEGDVVTHPGNKNKPVSDIWENDKKKQLLAEKKGFTVIEIWEYEINNCTDLPQLILQKIEGLLPQ